MSKIPSLLNKSIVFQALIALLALPFLSGCGVIGISNNCAEIRKSAEDKHGLGIAILDSAREGKVGEGMTLVEAERAGLNFILEGLKVIVANPKCFSKERVEQAEMLLSQK